MGYTAVYTSPIGDFLLKADNQFLTGLYFFKGKEGEVIKENEGRTHPVIQICMNQLDEYFQGTRKEFNLKLNNMGTSFRKKTWEELLKIPYGQVMTYKELALAIGNPNAVRAVGGANHYNNISIIVPCHRVIGSNGKLVGYGGEIWRKQWLLEHEQRYK